MGKLPPQPINENVLVGYDLASDAGVFHLGNDVALVQTIDFFTPISNDPEVYGRIAAVNALNDIYAMGGKPITALSIVCYPQKENLDLLSEILSGGQSAMNEEGVIILGGHSVDDSEVKIGYAVTGIVNPKHFITNALAQPGDALILTRPLGTGTISTAIKRGIASASSVEASVKVMTTSAALASREMQELGAHACTDITGFGLLGHAYEMARASKVSLVVEAQRVPLLPDVLNLISKGMLTRGDKNNKLYVGDSIKIRNSLSSEMVSALFDPQTAGGLLISIDRAKAKDLANRIEGAVVIGEVEEYSEFLIRVI